MARPNSDVVMSETFEGKCNACICDHSCSLANKHYWRLNCIFLSGIKGRQLKCYTFSCKKSMYLGKVLHTVGWDRCVAFVGQFPNETS